MTFVPNLPQSGCRRSGCRRRLATRSGVAIRAHQAHYQLPGHLASGQPDSLVPDSLVHGALDNGGEKVAAGMTTAVPSVSHATTVARPGVCAAQQGCAMPRRQR